MLDVRNEYLKWLSSEKLNKEEKNELESIKNNDKEMTDRFYCNLAFGTGGLRGVMGVGTNRMNRFIIQADLEV